MKLNLLISISMLVFTMSCGKSAQELATEQKAHDDSIKVETQDRIAKINDLKTSIQAMEKELSETKGSLAAAQDRMNTIKEWQLGRTPADREQQIKDQTILIDGLEKRIVELEKTIQQNTISLTELNEGSDK